MHVERSILCNSLSKGFDSMHGPGLEYASPRGVGVVLRWIGYVHLHTEFWCSFIC